MMEKQPPKQIYLQAYDSESYDDNTWCQDKITDDDIEYILQSEYDQLKAENERLQIEKVYFEELADKWSKQYYKDCDQLKSENERLAKENELMVETIKSLIASKNKLEDAYEYAKNNILLIYETATRLKGAQQALNEVKE